MGDVMSSSEGFRWMGPVRYDVVGAAKLLANNTYRAKVGWRLGRCMVRCLHICQ